jgi:hypothetical protein
MTNPVVAFDESGNTGSNLLDESQPVFVLASVYFSKEECEEIRSIVSPGGKMEMHFIDLKRRESGRKKIDDFLNSPLLTQERVKIFIVHKNFMIITKIVDLLIETLAYRDGLDLYEQGANIALANLLYYVMPVFCGRKDFERLKYSFVHMIRKRDRPSINVFYHLIHQLYNYCRDEEFKTLLSTLVATQTIIGDVLRDIPATELDPAVPTLFMLCGAWGDQFSGPFDLLHDKSKPITQNKELLEILMDPKEQGIKVGYDRRKITLPLKTTGIVFGDSKNMTELQIADILAGACAYWSGGMLGLIGKKNLSLAIGDSILPSLVINVIWPDTAMAPEELGTIEKGGINTADFIADLLKKKQEERK